MVSVVDVAATDTAGLTTISDAKVVIPGLQQRRLVFPNNPLDLPKLTIGEAAVTTRSYWRKPELCHLRVPLDVNMCRLRAIAGIKE